jgi:FlaA1/EpsC-like NDP-sugar epimerase
MKMDYRDLFENKVVLITGGTGFLGLALTKCILQYNPHSIRLFSRDEVKHHNAQELFKNDPRLRYLIGDVRDLERVKKAVRGAHIVIHAAALKRLDILEYNVAECIKTNIIGSMNVVDACLEENVEKAVFVSTDKACSPVNTYGAAKFVSERIFTESNFNKGKCKTIFTCVRYGNVLESTGSVIPFFESKLEDNEKIPVTDERMTRFIISPTEAVHLIFKALKYAIGGELFVPRLPAFKITDLIEILKEKHGKDPGVELIGIRPGEKIHELMINEAEMPRTYEFEDIYVISSVIAKYVGSPKAVYELQGKLMDSSKKKEYSSSSAVINKTELKHLFHELELL